MGDSFTHGDEVNDDGTWQCALERRTKRRVANHGVGGYGADQALLKAEQHWEEGRVASFTILCVYEDDLERVLNRYRPFLAPGTGTKLGFKPSLRKIGSRVVLLPNPLHADLITVKEIKALAISLIPTDYWASNAARVLPKFPYSVQLLGAVVRAFDRKFCIRKFSGNVWDIPEGRAVMFHILTEFTDLAIQHGRRPILVMIPKTSDWSHRRKTPAYKAFLREVSAKAHSNLLIVDIDDARFDERNFNLLPFRGHASTYGNDVIATAVLQRVGQLGHAEPPPD